MKILIESLPNDNEKRYQSQSEQGDQVDSPTAAILSLSSYWEFLQRQW